MHFFQLGCTRIFVCLVFFLFFPFFFPFWDASRYFPVIMEDPMPILILLRNSALAPHPPTPTHTHPHPCVSLTHWYTLDTKTLYVDSEKLSSPQHIHLYSHTLTPIHSYIHTPNTSLPCTLSFIHSYPHTYTSKLPCIPLTHPPLHKPYTPLRTLHTLTHPLPTPWHSENR